MTQPPSQSSSPGAQPHVSLPAGGTEPEPVATGRNQRFSPVPSQAASSGGRSSRRSFAWYGWLGLGLIGLTEAAIWANASAPGQWWLAYQVSQWATPLCWWGYIAAIDAWLFRREGWSYLTTRRWTFLAMLPLSVLTWLIFELYNLHLDNWHYWVAEFGPGGHWYPMWPGGAPLEMVVGSSVAFATIMPGLLMTADLLGSLGCFRPLRLMPLKPTARLIYAWVVLGFVCLIVPWLLPREAARYTFALVWVGFVLVLDPIVYSSGGDALLGHLERGSLSRLADLYVGGLICGVLWEFWNYWAAAKWTYSLPFSPEVHIFEMPVAGFWGFAPFAWEYHDLFQFARLFTARPLAPDLAAGR